MPTESQVAAVCAAINQEVDQVLKSTPFKRSLEDDPPKRGNLIVLNNSFLFREGIKTRKSTKYLCVGVEQDSPSLPAYVIEPGGINSRFKRLQVRQQSNFSPQPLEDSVKNELSQLGLIIRALVGKIGADEPATVTIDKVNNCRVLVYEPKQAKVVEVIDDAVSINRLDDVDTVWQSLTAEASDVGFELAEKFVEDFESKFAELREVAQRPVDINEVDQDSSILGEAIAHIDQQIVAYSAAFDVYSAAPDRADYLNDLLRISYNFADGAQELMRLIIGASDMKPIIFWLTLGAQSSLVDRFGDLPFSLVGRAKPSLERYRAVIAGARNQTFHNIFSFGRPFRVRLSGDAFQEAELLLFREYTNRRDPALNYADRRLVELLEGFTRRPSPPFPLVSGRRI